MSKHQNSESQNQRMQENQMQVTQGSSENIISLTGLVAGCLNQEGSTPVQKNSLSEQQHPCKQSQQLRNPGHPPFQGSNHATDRQHYAMLRLDKEKQQLGSRHHHKQQKQQLFQQQGHHVVVSNSSRSNVRRDTYPPISSCPQNSSSGQQQVSSQSGSLSNSQKLVSSFTMIPINSEPHKRDYKVHPCRMKGSQLLGSYAEEDVVTEQVPLTTQRNYTKQRHRPRLAEKMSEQDITSQNLTDGPFNGIIPSTTQGNQGAIKAETTMHPACRQHKT